MTVNFSQYNFDFRSQSLSANETQAVNSCSKIQAMELIKNILLVGLKFERDIVSELRKALVRAVKDLQNQSDSDFSIFICTDPGARDIFITLLNALFISVYNTETRLHILPFFKLLISHLTIMTILESNRGQ